MTVRDQIVREEVSASVRLPRVLLSAYQCAPGLGSVSQIGWEWYRRLSRRTPVTLVTHVRNRAHLEAAGAPFENSEIIYIDTEWFAGPLYRLATRLFPKSQHAVFLLSSLDFYVYDWAAVAELRRRRSHGAGWDLVHAATPVSPVASTRLHRLGLPLIVGPWNGGLRSPTCFPEIMKQDSAWLYPIRNAGRILDFLLGGSRRAAAILTATHATTESLPSRARRRCIPMLENGVDLDLFRPKSWPDAPSGDRPLKVLFVGRLLPFKGVPMLLEAVAQFRRESAVEVRVIGEGPMKSEWTQLAKGLGISDIVTFCGPAPLAAIPDHMAWAHVFCLPSVRESGGAVLLEAMAAGRPSIAIGYGGPAELIDDEIGRALPPAGKHAVMCGFIEAFRDIVRRPELWRKRGLEARRRAESLYSWESKIDSALSIYNDLPEAM
jgi:glycosyltransferase involved in cell wall biosynthesis